MFTRRLLIASGVCRPTATSFNRFIPNKRQMSTQQSPFLKQTETPSATTTSQSNSAAPLPWEDSALLGKNAAAPELKPLTGPNQLTGEVNGPRGPEPTRYGDFERAGRCYDF